MMHLVPGDAAEIIAEKKYVGRKPQLVTVERVRKEVGLWTAWFSASIFTGYPAFYGGDFGDLFAPGAPFYMEIMARLSATAMLALAAGAGVFFGDCYPCRRRFCCEAVSPGLKVSSRRPGDAGCFHAQFLVGLLLIMAFFVPHFRWFPVYGYESLKHLVFLRQHWGLVSRRLPPG